MKAKAPRYNAYDDDNDVLLKQYEDEKEKEGMRLDAGMCLLLLSCLLLRVLRSHLPVLFQRVFLFSRHLISRVSALIVSRSLGLSALSFARLLKSLAPLGDSGSACVSLFGASSFPMSPRVESVSGVDKTQAQLKKLDAIRKKLATGDAAKVAYDLNQEKKVRTCFDIFLSKH